MQYVFRTDRESKIKTSVNNLQVMKVYLDLVKPGGVECTPEIKKTDIEIVVIDGILNARNKIQDTLIIVYDPELKVYKLFEKKNMPDTIIYGFTMYRFIGMIRTIPLPLKYVKNIFKDFFEGIHYNIGYDPVMISLRDQILTLFKLIVQEYKCKKSTKCKKTTKSIKGRVTCKK
jgi:hypothetical protein